MEKKLINLQIFPGHTKIIYLAFLIIGCIYFLCQGLEDFRLFRVLTKAAIFKIGCKSRREDVTGFRKKTGSQKVF
jgi:hypothetical protein